MTTQISGSGVNANQQRMRRAMTQAKDTKAGTKDGRTVPAPLPATPCHGLHNLFDSTDMADHWAARELCVACPIITACMRNLVDVRRTGGPHGQPVGTWAGQLFDDPRPGDRRARYARSKGAVA